jgi:hypothetical protein
MLELARLCRSRIDNWSSSFLGKRPPEPQTVLAIALVESFRFVYFYLGCYRFEAIEVLARIQNKGIPNNSARLRPYAVAV